MERTSNSWKRRKLLHLEFFYDDHYKAWKDLDTHDDRQLYCNTYEMIKEAIESLDDNPLSFVCVAMNDRIDKEEIILDSIVTNFNSL